MTWKSYATVSGATVLAGWLASSAPAPPPGTPAAPRPQAAGAASADIVRQAERLRARESRERAYAAPARDPFRFASRTPAPQPPVPEVDGVEETPPRDPGPSTPLITLSGIAEDQVDGRAVRTAVLSAPSDVLLVQEGADVLGRFRVVRIESEAVELLDLTTGGTVRLGLR